MNLSFACLLQTRDRLNISSTDLLRGEGKREGIVARLFVSLMTVYGQHDCGAVPMCHVPVHVMDTSTPKPYRKKFI